MRLLDGLLEGIAVSEEVELVVGDVGDLVGLREGAYVGVPAR